jgi:hypothetical protein
MSYLTAAVIVASFLGLVNLWLIVAIARKLREHGRLLARQQRPPRPRPLVSLSPGTPVPQFNVRTVSGAVVSTAGLLGERSLIGFFMPGCVPCHNQIPAFITLARSLPGGPGHALAVVSYGGRPMARVPAHDVDRLVKELAETDAVQVVPEPSAKVAATALAVTGYPSFILLGADGRVEASENVVASLGGIPALADSAGRSG